MWQVIFGGLRWGGISALLALGACAATAERAPVVEESGVGALAPYTERLPEDEVIYFVLPDRFENGDPANDFGGLEGGRLVTGFDPTNNGFYHGGDLKGLTDQLDYLQALGMSAVWLTPIFENKPVQGPPGHESAGYHGYWITDFLNVDPHLGTREDFKAFVDAAHARNMKVYMDIITNHSADVIKFDECHGPDAPAAYREAGICPYRDRGSFPYSTRGNSDGEAINDGFLGDGAAHQTVENFDRLTDPAFAYSPFVPEAEATVKNPAWMNDPIHYHNRGDTDFEGENSRHGDFAGLDDFFTESPVVVDGFIDVYKQWITDFRVDGYRIDTTKHVNPEFWQVFIPAIEAHAKAEGINNFHIFGEVYEFDPGQLAKFTVVDGLPTVLDFAFQGTAKAVVIDGAPAREFERLFEVDQVYAGGAETARRLPTFLGNHDMGRFAGMLHEAQPEMDDRVRYERIRLGHAMMMFSRGVPTVYYGDEQGFVSDGGDRPARENMFASQVPDYNDNDLVATDATTAERNFDQSHPLFEAIAEMSAVRHAHVGLRRGDQHVLHSDRDGGLLILSRMDPEEGVLYLLGFNADGADRSFNVAVDGRALDWVSVLGACGASSAAPGSYHVEVPARDFIVCASDLVDAP